jgi:hypothetical protein
MKSTSGIALEKDLAIQLFKRWRVVPHSNRLQRAYACLTKCPLDKTAEFFSELKCFMCTAKVIEHNQTNIIVWRGICCPITFPFSVSLLPDPYLFAPWQDIALTNMNKLKTRL